MYIKSINIKSVYSFSDEGTPELKDLKSINLFIGKNGAGKTNIVRALLLMPIGDVYLPDTINNEVIPTVDPKRIFKGILGQQNRFLYSHQGLEITVDEGIITTEPINERTPFTQDGSGRASKFTEGSYELLLKLRESSLYISSKPVLATESTTPISKEPFRWVEEEEVLLQFAFFYIFGKYVSKNGNEITEYKNSNNDGGLGGSRMNYDTNADGYISLSNILIRLVNNKKDVIFIEEPENNLEPRAIKRLIYFLVYYLLGKESLPSEIVNDLDQEFEKYKLSKVHYSKYSTLEPFLTEIEKIVKSNSKKVSQLFFISHSPIIIDTLSQLPIETAIYEIFGEKTENKYSVNTEGIGIDYGEPIYTEVSKIRKVDNVWDSFTVLNNIGAKNSDLLQANGLIWVEGPSDAMYIKKFLELYNLENQGIKPLLQSKDYEFAIYGGTLLSSYYLYEKGDTDKYLDKLVSIVSQNKNFYVIMDSDAIQNEEEIIDQSKFKAAKDYIAASIDKISTKYDYVGYWYSKGNVNFRTIESYIKLEQKTLTQLGIKDFGKTYKRRDAIKIIKYLDENKISLKEINIDLKNEIKKLYEMILKWNS